MADVIVIGDGPGGLSAALFLAKNGLDVVVYGTDDTAMHWAHLHNYLGAPDIAGSDFQAIAKKQVTDQGGVLVSAKVTALAAEGDTFGVTLESGDTATARYLVLSEGKSPALAQTLGLEVPRTGIAVDANGRTAVDRVYAVGRMVRPGRSQAIISAGDGAAAAIDILAREKGKDRFADWDSPPEA